MSIKLFVSTVVCACLGMAAPEYADGSMPRVGKLSPLHQGVLTMHH